MAGRQKKLVTAVYSHPRCKSFFFSPSVKWGAWSWMCPSFSFLLPETLHNCLDYDLSNPSSLTPGYLDALPICYNVYFFCWMLINWVQGLLHLHKSAFLWLVPQQHACDPWLLGLPLKRKGESKEVGMGWGSLTGETEPRAESKVEETSVLHPSHALHLSDTFHILRTSRGWLALLKLASVHASVLASPPARRERCGSPTDSSI